MRDWFVGQYVVGEFVDNDRLCSFLNMVRFFGENLFCGIKL